MIDAIAEMGAEWPLSNKCLTANIVHETVVQYPAHKVRNIVVFKS